MPSLPQSLLALQITDDEIDALRRRIRSLQFELGDDSALADSRARLEGAQAALAAAQRAVANGEMTLETLNRTIALLEKRLYDGSIHTAREATSVEEELRHRRADRVSCEDALLEAMESVESAREELEHAQRRIADVQAEHDRRTPAIKTEGRDATARLKVMQERRAALVAAAPASILSRYEHLTAATRPAVVPIHNGVCGGCGVAVPTGVRQKAVAGDIVQCLNCNRLLVDE